MKILMVIALMLFSSWLMAQPSSAPVPAAQPAVTVIHSESSASELQRLREQNLLLTEQLKVTKEFQGQLLDGVMFAMTTVITVGVLLVATNFFTAWRTRSSDRALLLSEVSASAGALRSEVLEKANTNANDLLQQVASRLETQSEAMATELRNVRDAAASNKDRVDDAINGLLKDVTLSRAAQVDSDNRIKKFRLDFEFVKSNFYSLEAYVHEFKKSYLLKLMAASRALKAAFDAENSVMFKNRAEQMLDVLSTNFSGDDSPKLTPSIRKFINTHLPDMHEEHGDLLAAIRAAVELIPSERADPEPDAS